MSDSNKAEIENAETQAINLGEDEENTPVIPQFVALYDGMFVQGPHENDIRTDGFSRPKVGDKLQKDKTALSDKTMIMSFEQWGNFIAKNKYNMVRFTFCPAKVITMIALDEIPDS